MSAAGKPWNIQWDFEVNEGEHRRFRIAFLKSEGLDGSEEVPDEEFDMVLSVSILYQTVMSSGAWQRSGSGLTRPSTRTCRCTDRHGTAASSAAAGKARNLRIECHCGEGDLK